MIDPVTWYFFGVVCMTSAPTNCKRIVFDEPMQVTDIYNHGLMPPLRFKDAAHCLVSLSINFGSELQRARASLRASSVPTG